MKIGEYLIKAIRKTGTRHVFGIQGDYVLNFYTQLCKSPIKVINTCSEQGAGFAADAYARMTGFGVVCVTYGVGGLSLANSTAQAFAERSPVLIISGAPGISERQHEALLHHKVRSFETQLNVFREMTAAQAVLKEAESAAVEIDRVIYSINRTKKPGYIELPRDMVQAEIGESRVLQSEPSFVDQSVIDEAIHEAMDMLAAAKRPIIMAGLEVHRFGLQEPLLKFLERSGVPFVTGILGKSVVSEKHPQFVGVYVGGMSPDNVREAVEEADCVIAIGLLITDLATGIFTHHIDPGRLILLALDDLSIRHHSYPGLGMKTFLESMIAAMPQAKPTVQSLNKYEIPSFVPIADKVITMERLIMYIDTFLSNDTVVIAEAGDALFAALDLHVHDKSEFLSPAYYASLGFAVPASIGVQFAAPNRRPLVLVGDGSFQMSGMELSITARYGLSPIVIILNNGGYGTFRPMMDGDFNDIQPWQYADIVKIIGAGQGYIVSTEKELVDAFESAKKNSSSPTIIDVRLDKHDCSARLKSLADKLKKRIK